MQIQGLNKLRSETRGCQNVIHFNNAGASLMAEPTLQSVTEYLEQEAAYGGYETAQKRKTDLSQVYHSISELVNADPKEIAILENATAAWNMAFYSIPFSTGDRILTSVSEYASNYINYLKLQKTTDITVEVIPNDEFGQTSVSSLSEMVDEKVRLISITHIPTNNGLVNPAEEIGAIAEKYDCLYLLDACQSVGHYPVDVRKIGCDLLSATGRKYLRAPRGTGFLYVNSDIIDILVPPFLDLHSAEWTQRDDYSIRNDARRFENWETNYAGVLGLNTAVKYALDLGIQNIWQRIQYLADVMRNELLKIPSVSLHDIGSTQSGIVTFTIKGYECNQIQEYLATQGINVSVSTKRSTLIDMQNRNLDEVIRASVHYYNIEQEVADLTAALRSLL